jgi:hypothetical protein
VVMGDWADAGSGAHRSLITVDWSLSRMDVGPGLPRPRW